MDQRHYRFVLRVYGKTATVLVKTAATSEKVAGFASESVAGLLWNRFIAVSFGMACRFAPEYPTD